MYSFPNPIGKCFNFSRFFPDWGGRKFSAPNGRRWFPVWSQRRRCIWYTRSWQYARNSIPILILIYQEFKKKIKNHQNQKWFHDKAKNKKRDEILLRRENFPQKNNWKNKNYFYIIKRKIVLFCEDSVSVSDENNVLCCLLWETKLCWRET